MPSGRITKRAVDALQCPAGRDRDFLWDDALAGFGVAAFPSGKKVYVAQYRQRWALAPRRHRRAWPVDARRSPLASQDDLGRGGDGRGPDRRAARRARGADLQGGGGRFHARFMSPPSAKGARAPNISVSCKHIRPAIGSKRIVDVRRADMARLHGKLADRPTKQTARLPLCPLSGIGRRGVTKWRRARIPVRELNAIPNRGASGS